MSEVDPGEAEATTMARIADLEEAMPEGVLTVRTGEWSGPDRLDSLDASLRWTPFLLSQKQFNL